jgi:hypothetical protein
VRSSGDVPALAPPQHLNLLCFCDDGPDTSPHPIGQEKLRAAFNPSDGTEYVATIEPDRIETSYHDDGAPAGSRQCTQIISVRAQRLQWIRRSGTMCRENTGGRGANPERKN